MSPYRTDVMTLENILADWRSFWSELGLELDISPLRIPERQDGFNRLLVMPKGATAKRLYAKCAELFPCWRYLENLDAVISDRDPAKLGAYAIWIRGRVEADKELSDKFVNPLVNNIKNMTLPERLAFELKYFKETRKHLDIKSMTRCRGSYVPGGYQPCVSFFVESGELFVVGDCSTPTHEFICGRAVVTL